jgi:hypothetical protein
VVKIRLLRFERKISAHRRNPRQPLLLFLEKSPVSASFRVFCGSRLRRR